MRFFGENFLVAGLKKSGVAAAELLLSHGAKVFLYERLETALTRKNAEDLKKRGAVLLSKEEVGQVIERCRAVVLSPGVPIDDPISLLAHEKNVRVTGETELAAYFLKAPAVAVTGTNGKTTTVTMISRIFEEGGIAAPALGNIGVPLSSRAEELGDKDVAVVEVSSFQLETIRSFTPHVAVLTNFSEDHLNRHYTMANYRALKKRLFFNLKESEYAVLNAEDALSREIAAETKARVCFFSSERKVDGAYLAGGFLWFKEEKLFPAASLALKEKHNIENALAAIAVTKIFGVPTEAMLRALSAFRGARHRMELAGSVSGVTFVNDSKATNPASALSAVRCMKKPTVLLVGGSDKGYSYLELFRALENSAVRYVVIYGENRKRVEDDCRASGFSPFAVAEDLKEAVAVAKAVAKPGEVVLLSPASASFDAFSGYDERGEAFIRFALGEKA